MEAVTDFLLTYPEAYLGLVALLIGVAVICSSQLGRIWRERKLFKRWCDLASPAEINGFAQRLPDQHRAKWRDLIQAVPGSAKLSAVRVGHLFWASEIVKKGMPVGEIPLFEPPAGAPYRESQDIGMPQLVRYIIAIRDGQHMEAFRHLAEGAALGSPICMSTYGVCLVEGRVPGLAADPASISMIEAAVEKGAGAGALGELLIEGRFVPQDCDRGLALLRQAAGAGDESAASDLGVIYCNGLHGVPVDQAEADRWILQGFPRRRLLASIGISQTAFVRRVVGAIVSMKAEVAGNSYWENHKAFKEMADRRLS